MQKVLGCSSEVDKRGNVNWEKAFDYSLNSKNHVSIIPRNKFPHPTLSNMEQSFQILLQKKILR